MDPQQILSRLRALFASFTPTQLASLSLAFVLVVGVIVGSAWWLNAPTYALLYADMDAESAGEIVTRLKNLQVPYQLDGGGRGIRVPAARVDELRIELAAEGMPTSGRIGFEIFDRTAFGATEFLEQVNYRRALEGEIARTIGTLSDVSGARVHIAMGQDSLFGDATPAKASVVLKLRGQRQLAASTIQGIGNLVAGSVEGLRPDAVTILDSFGRALSRSMGDSDDPLGAGQIERRQRLERDMATKVVAMLEPVVGHDRVRVNVALSLNPQTLEETEELWDPNTVVRSRQTTTDLSNTGAVAGGIAGASANRPPPVAEAEAQAQAQAATVPGAAPGSSRSAEITNYEVSRVTRHTVQPSGDVSRLSVAVIVDDDQVASRDEDGQLTMTRVARDQGDLDKLRGLVAAAVGLEPSRGDQLTVENVSFDEPLIEEGTPETVLERYAPQVWEGSRILIVTLLALFALTLFVRPLMQRASAQLVPATSGPGVAAMAAPGGAALKTVAELESEMEAELDAEIASRREGRRLPTLTRRVSALTAKEPENVAKLLRSWMSEPEH